ncbi:hypothetical protein COTS27_00252 [Spirochaetota bacterium]|nr:hypothetical protein COTS27_00252 [Spirochaetota bacterium]
MVDWFKIASKLGKRVRISLIMHGLWAAVLWLVMFGGEPLYAGDQVNVGTVQLKAKVLGVKFPVRLYYRTPIERVKLSRFGSWHMPVVKQTKKSMLESMQESAAATGTDFFEEKYPLVVISHGLGGSDWTHYVLVADLVAAGFIVAAPKHPYDLLRVGKIKQALARPQEFSAAIDVILKDELFASVIDTNRIGAFGYSLGGYTVLAAAGGVAKFERVVEYCKLPASDPALCRYVKKPIGAKKSISYISGNDKRIKTIVVAAPFGVIFSDLTEIKQPVLLYRVVDDKLLLYPNHAEHIHKLLPISHDYELIEDRTHYSFLTPFTKRVSIKPGIDFDNSKRMTFLKTINEQIIQFFKKTL